MEGRESSEEFVRDTGYLRPVHERDRAASGVGLPLGLENRALDCGYVLVSPMRLVSNTPPFSHRWNV
jgi:hypothetical protein